ncbi:FtsX-like permease family protein [Desertivirga brevis]|uniref:FtsX-like permease family protein n=1 Tax=Desertivirga brevis TaxID=2810310 RepID=UPI001A970570|nr:FtsX-like permease family protein [Pedobacter sp. SYSU D00873]
MRTSFYIAKRYLFTKKSLNAINYISGISMLGVFVGSAALVIILSVFNGFEKVILSMYNNFTPEIRIEPAQGKSFDPNSPKVRDLKYDKRITNYTEVLQEKALLRYEDGQYIGTIKGVSPDFLKRSKLDSTLVQGSFVIEENSKPYAVVGSMVQLYLSINVNDQFRELEIYSPKKGVANAFNPAEEFTLKTIKPVGVFQIQQSFDESVIVPLSFARELLGEEKNISSIELYLSGGESTSSFQKELSQKLGKDFLVKNRVQQEQSLYKTLNIERLMIYLILTFVLIIAIFNIVGTLTMLVIDKKKDIAILSSIGADTSLIRRIFLLEGLLISFVGCFAGMVAGLIFCILQQKYGFIQMAEANFITEAYPVAIKWTDFLVVFGTVAFISTIASSISSRLSVKNLGDMKEDL